MEKVRVSLTLTGEQAQAFEELAVKKYGSNRYRRSKLLRLAVEGILGSGGKVTFARLGSGELSPTFNLPRTPTTIPNGGFTSTNPWALELKNELENGDSEGAKLFRLLKKKVDTFYFEEGQPLTP